MTSTAAAAKSLQSCPTLCDPIDGSPPGSPLPAILQARTLEWVATAFSNAWKRKVKSENEVTQSCLTLNDPMDCSLPGSSVHGIFQARVLEWVAIAFSRPLLQCFFLILWTFFFSHTELQVFTAIFLILTYPCFQFKEFSDNHKPSQPLP